jgi:hypothetical protein
MDTRERILRKIGSSPITNWILTKLLMVKRRRMHKLRVIPDTPAPVIPPVP